MIDPYLLRDKDDPDKWWCFYEQEVVGVAFSQDLENWTDFGRIEAGENPCILIDEDEYVLFYAPDREPNLNGIGIKRSYDLIHWRDFGVITLGQAEWPWAQGRITAAHVLDLRDHSEVGKYVMFFHGSIVTEEHILPETHGAASLGIAWSDDLDHWDWPGI